MKTFSKFCVLLVAVLAAGSANAIACTIVSGTDSQGTTWAGNNEDMLFHFGTSLKILPREKHKLGAMIVTYSNGYPQGGVNEKGLFFDFNALSPLPISSDPNWDKKRNVPRGENIVLEMLQRFDNVHSAIEYLSQYRGMLAEQMHIADAQGNLAVFAGDGYCYKKGYQVSTNFRVCAGDINAILASDPVGLWRYPLAVANLKDRVNRANIKKALQDTAQKKMSSTIYSFIANLNTTDIELYYGNDFEHSYQFNVREMASQGAKSMLMRELFPNSPLVKLWSAYKNQGVEEALSYFRNGTAGMPAAARQELLRHLYTNLLLDIDPGSLDFASAEVFFNEWMKGERNGTEVFFQGIFALTHGDYAKARKIYAGLTAQAIVDRIDGKKVPDANVHVELPGYQDAKFVYVNRLSKGFGFFDFLTRTETGWAGDFNALYPNSNYEIVVDGVVVKRRYDRPQE